jgi:cation:H+ antiporter
VITTFEILGGFVLLLFGAEYLVRGAVGLANRFNVSPMVIGMTIVA